MGMFHRQLGFSERENGDLYESRHLYKNFFSRLLQRHLATSSRICCDLVVPMQIQTISSLRVMADTPYFTSA